MSDHQWKFFVSTEATWQELLAACERATVSIDFEQYILDFPGLIEEQFIDKLYEKAKQGVRIRLLLDAFGSFSFYRSVGCKKLTDVGVEINFHFAILPPPLKRVLPFVLRDHRKLLVIDGKEAHIGGVIIREKARHWRDTFVRIRGPVVKDLQEAFEKAWKRTLRNLAVGQVKSQNDRKEFCISGNSFHLRDKDLYRAFLKAITGAKNHIYITTPYFFPNYEFLRAIRFARRKGVEVVFLFPKVSDNRLADFLSKFYYKKLQKKGVKIYLYSKSILHAKTMVVDGNWATVGSCNFDVLSFWWNYELNLISTNQEFVKELEMHFLQDMETSEEIS